MGTAFSQAISDAKERDGKDFILEGAKIKSKETTNLLKKINQELPELQLLEVRSKLKLIPPCISILKKLEILRLSENKLSALPKEITDCASLVELDLANNQFQKLPVEIASMGKLTSLNFSSNQINQFPAPKTSKDFYALEKLILEKNEFTEFPRSICSLVGLRVLNLNENPLTSIPAGDFCNLVNLRELYLRRTQITEIPSTISKLKQLNHFDCSENQISFIPIQISELVHLQSLEAQHNCIIDFREELCSILSLSILKLHDNQISIIPPSISKLINLTDLYLQENQISVLPTEICKLSNLRKLYLEYNKLSSIPDEIADLKKLVILILHNNNIRMLPASLANMTNLLRLSLDHNPLDSFTLKIIQETGALSLIKREADNNPNSKKFNTIQRRSLHRAGISSSTIGQREITHKTQSATEHSSLKNSSTTPDFASLNLNLPAQPALSRTTSERFSLSKSDTMSKITTPRKSKPSDSDKDIPSFSKFKFAFDSLLEEQDFSKKKKEMLKKLPETEKWTLLTQYKGSTLELLKRDKSSGQGGLLKRTLGGDKSSTDFVAIIKEGRLNKNTVTKMKSSFKSNKGEVSKFVETGGISALAQYIQATSTKKALSQRDHSLIKDCLELFEILLEVSLKSILTISGAVSAIALPLALEDVHNKFLAIKLLEDICSKEIHIGPQLVLEAINSNAHNVPKEFRFLPLIQCLESNSKPDEIACALSLINQIIDSITGLEERFELRTEFMRSGFQGILAQLQGNDEIAMEREIFEEQTKNDYEDMRCRFNRKDVIEKMLSASRDGSISIAVVTGSIQCSFSIRLDVDITIGDILNQIVKKFAIVNKDDYGLCIRSEEHDTPDEWLELDKLFAESVKPELVSRVEFRMKPWTLEIEIVNIEKQTFSFDPNITCEQAVHLLIMNYPQLPKANYCLMLKDTALPDTASLDQTPLVEKENREILKFRERPLRLKVILTEDIWQMMEFEPDKELSGVFAQIGNYFGRVFSLANFSLVLESPDFAEPITLQEGQLLRDFVTSDACRLRFISKGLDNDEVEEQEECHIWQEPPDAPKNISYEKGKENAIENVETATLNKLVELVTSPEEYDVDFVHVFTMMYSAFTTEDKLLDKLKERFMVPDRIEAGNKLKIQVRVCIFIKHWVEKDPYLTDDAKNKILTFLQESVTEQSFEIMVKAITGRILHPKSRDDDFQLLPGSHSSAKPPTPILPRNIVSTAITLHDLDELEIARQLTLLTFSIYKKIEPNEFFKLAWTKEKTKHLAPNVLQLVDYYNKVSNTFATVIVMENNVRERTKMMQKIIDIAAKLRELNNFHLLSAFVSAINNSAVDRLKFTRARLSRRHTKTLQELEQVMSMEGSFKSFREALSATAPPCIPFMGVYLTDLIFIDEGNPNKIENRINFVKHKFVHSVISRIQAYQSVGYTLDTVEAIQQFINELPILGEKELYAQSLKIEPRGATRAEIL